MSSTTQRVPFVDLGAQRDTIRDQVNEAMAGVLERTDFILGQAVADFETAFASYCDVPYAIGVDSGTSALELALRAVDVGPGDEVITTANTFIATVLAISGTGATPVLVDVDDQSYNMDIAKVETALTDRTKAIMPVHLYGQPVDMDPLLELARSRGIRIVEDAAQAHGARYKGRRAGSMGDAAAFSFYPAKNLGAYGDGGIVVTNDAEIADRVQMLRNYGQRKKYYHSMRGYNRRLDTMQAAILGVKLPYLDDWNAARDARARQYTELLADTEIVTPAVMDFAQPVWHLYVVRVKQRDAFQAYLSERNIFTGIHYPVPIHLQEAYRDIGYPKGSFPITEAHMDEIVSLPMYPELSAEAVEYVSEVIHEFVRGG